MKAARAKFGNPASLCVLEKYGFEKTGAALYNGSGRLEKAPLFLYRLACTHRIAS